MGYPLWIRNAKTSDKLQNRPVLIVQTSGILTIILIHEVKGVLACLVIISSPGAEAD